MNSGSTYYEEFEELFKLNYSKLFFFALDWVEDSEAAKDIVSDIFSDVWADYARLRKKSLLSYMTMAVRNRSINYLKHNQVAQSYRNDILKCKQNVFANDLDEQEYNLRTIEKVLESLSPETRLIFEQCYFYGKKYKEQADEMGISLSAINKHMNKAFAAFRSAFAKKCEKGAKKLLVFALNLLL